MKTPTKIVRQCVQVSLHPHGFPLNYNDAKMTFLVTFIVLSRVGVLRSSFIGSNCSSALVYSLPRA